MVYVVLQLERLKANINREIEENDIEIYQFPDCDSDEDEDFQDQDRTLKDSIPFAIVSATHVLEVIKLIRIKCKCYNTYTLLKFLAYVNTTVNFIFYYF